MTTSCRNRLATWSIACTLGWRPITTRSAPSSMSSIEAPSPRSQLGRPAFSLHGCSEVDMARFKLNDVDEDFLKLPQGAALISAGSSGTQTWIERDRDMVVHIAIKSVAVATADG